MGTQNISQAVSDIASIFYNTKISQTIGQFTRVSICNYTSTSNTIYPIDLFKSTSMFENIIWNIIPKNTTQPVGEIARGLQEARSTLYRRSNQPNVPRAILIFASDYNTNDVIEAIQQAQSIKSGGTKIIVIDYSKAQNINGLADIATPGMVFLAHDPQLINKTQSALCIANAYCQYSGDWTQVSDSFPSGTKFKGECIWGASDAIASGGDTTSKCSFGGSENSYLINILDEDKQNFVYGFAQFGKFDSYWIGLRYRTSGAGWDQMAGDEPIPVTASNYSDWYPGGYSLASLTEVYPYVAMTTDKNAKGWITSIDTETIYYSYICEKKTCDTDNFCLF